MELSVILLVWPFLWLHDLLSFLENVLILHHAGLVIEVTARRLLVHKVKRMVHELIVHFHNGSVPTHRYTASITRPTEHMLRLLQLRAHSLVIELALDHVDAPPHRGSVGFCLIDLSNICQFIITAVHIVSTATPYLVALRYR